MSLAFISKPLGSLLFFIYDFVGNYGITLILFTIIFRFCILPLYLSQMKHTSKMGELQPKMQELQRKYGNDKEKYNQKIMELYNEEGANPAKGCLPMLIQMPIIIGLFALLRNPTKYIAEPAMILAIHEKFLWIPDLAQPDPWIMPILAGLGTYVTFSLSSNSNAQMGQAAATMKIMKYIFPVMIFIWGRSFPAGLTLYWFIGSCFQVVQTVVFKQSKKIKERKKAAAESA